MTAPGGIFCALKHFFNEVTMQWFEIIHIRAYTQASREQAIKEAGELTAAKAPGFLEAVTFWVRSDLETDVSILLFWSKNLERLTYSSVGLQIAEDFSRFGWVDHSVWMDPKGTAKKGEKHRAH